MVMTTAEHQRFVVSYVLTVDGEEVDRSLENDPLVFVPGFGEVIPGFERQIVSLGMGDSFDFVVEPEEGYGRYDESRVFDVPLETFMVDGKLQHDFLEPGTPVPMLLRDGGHILGTVKEVKNDTVLMDFNHELAGKQLHFVGTVEGIEEVTPEDLEDLLSSRDCCCGGGCHHGGCDCEHHEHPHEHHEGGCCNQCPQGL